MPRATPSAPRLKFEITFADQPRVDEAAEILEALDTAFRAFADANGMPGAFLAVERVEQGSLLGWLSVIGTAAEIAELAIDRSYLLQQFLMHAHAGVRLTLDTHVIDPVRTMLAICARPVAEKRAGSATIGDADANGPALTIDKTNASPVLSRSARPLRRLRTGAEIAADKAESARDQDEDAAGRTGLLTIDGDRVTVDGDGIAIDPGGRGECDRRKAHPGGRAARIARLSRQVRTTNRDDIVEPGREFPCRGRAVDRDVHPRRLARDRRAW